jgi:hypothetical protein
MAFSPHLWHLWHLFIYPSLPFISFRNSTSPDSSGLGPHIPDGTLSSSISQFHMAVYALAVFSPLVLQ